ncbi:MAG: hypothetical protein R2911_09235 [Caldilineaceae bacterium]
MPCAQQVGHLIGERFDLPKGILGNGAILAFVDERQPVRLNVSPLVADIHTHVVVRGNVPFELGVQFWIG